MSRLVNLPTFNVDGLKTRAHMVDVVGSALSTGRDSAGAGLSMELSGGGTVIASYDCIIYTPEQHEEINALGARMNGSFRYINAVILSDFMGPFPIINGKRAPIITGIRHSDGSPFSDSSGYSQATVYGEIVDEAALNAGVIRMQVFGAHRPLRLSDWFSIRHPTRGWRAYRYWEVISRTDGENPIYELAINPPLREAVAAGTRVEFARPRFVAKFPEGFTLPWQFDLNYIDEPTIQFVEAMR